MEEPNKCSQSGGERSTPPSRPFFYVQSPMHPFYTYQWHQHNPQNYPGSGFPFARPYLLPYSYLQYPGYVMPHSTVHPVDYRRIYERNVPHSTYCDVTLRPHQHPSPGPRETTCAGAQTEPCDALNKLIECLDQLRAGDFAQTSGSSSSLTEEPKCESGTIKRNQNDGREEKCSGTDENPCVEQVHPQNHSEVIHSEHTDGSKEQRNLKESQKEEEGTNEEWLHYNTSPMSHSSPVSNEILENLQRAEDDDSGDLSYCILHLPFQKVLSSGVYGSSITSPSFGSPVSYTYPPPKLAHERLSVLSASLDELSSHDELLSTDLEDLDLFPSQIYSRAKIPEFQRGHAPKLCLLYPKRLRCTTCGSHTFTELSRTKAHHYEDLTQRPNDDQRTTHISTKTRDRCLRCAAAKKQASLKPRLRVKREEPREKWEGPQETQCSAYFYCENCRGSPEKGRITKESSGQPDQHCRLTSDQLMWESSAGHNRVKSYRRRKAQCKSQVCSGSRTKRSSAVNEEEDEDEDVLQYHRGKGPTNGNGAWC